MKTGFPAPRFVLCLLAACLSLSVSADTVTLTATNSAAASFTVPADQVAQIVSSFGPCGSASQVTIMAGGGVTTYELNRGGINYTYSFGSNPGTIAIPPPTIAGPAVIALTNGCPIDALPVQLAFCTIQLSPVRSSTTSPSTALVVPNDGGGPVTIILESSVDLHNWTPAQPGIYSATTATNRFFRIRAER